MASPKVYETNVMFKVVGGLTLSTITFVIWFVLMVQASYIPPPRAVTAGEHEFCTTMPRGNQVMENKRLACFNELYGSGRFKTL